MNWTEVGITVAPWVAFAANVVANIVLLRSNPSRTIVRSLFSSFLVGGLVFLVALLLLGRPLLGANNVARCLSAALTYLCVSYFFFHIVHIPEASVRLRVLQELAASQTLSQGQILERYNAASILNVRLHRLVRSGQLVTDSGRFYTGRKRMLYVAQVFSISKRILLGSKP